MRNRSAVVKRWKPTTRRGKDITLAFKAPLGPAPPHISGRLLPQ
jgi:hypothetical protein